MRDPIRRFRAEWERVPSFTRNARLLLIAIGLIGISYGAFTTLFNLYIIELGYDEGFLGLLVATGSAVGALSAVPAGLFCDRFGTRLGLLLGTAIVALGILLETIVTLGWILLAGAAIAAVGVALVYVGQAPFFAANSTAEERTYVFSVAAALLVATSIVGSLFAGFFPDLLHTVRADLSVAAGYRLTLLAAGGLSALCVGPLLRLREPATRERVERSREALALCLRSVAVRRLVLTGLLLSVGGGLVVPFFNIFFANELSAGTGALGLIRSAGIVVTVAGSLAAPWLGRRFGLVGGVALARAASAPFLLAMALTPVLAGAVVAYAVRTFLVYLGDPLHTDFSMRIVPPQARATANSLTFMSWSVTLAVGGWLGGVLIARVGYTLPFVLGTLLTVVAGVAYWLLFRAFADRASFFSDRAEKRPSAEAVATE